MFIKLNRLDGTLTVLSPARRGEERVWTRPLGETADEQRCADYFAKQIRFDPDIWIVEIEDRVGPHLRRRTRRLRFLFEALFWPKCGRRRGAIWAKHLPAC